MRQTGIPWQRHFAPVQDVAGGWHSQGQWQFGTGAVPVPVAVAVAFTGSLSLAIQHIC